MKNRFKASAASILALALAVPAFAGGGHCSGESAAMAENGSCASHTMTSAWSGACLQRSASGKITVADVAKGSPAAKSGLKTGDIVLAVNGYDLSNADHRAMCASKASCNVGSAVTYTVQRGKSTKDVKFKLEKAPAQANQKFPSHLGTFDPTLAAVVMPAANSN